MKRTLAAMTAALLMIGLVSSTALASPGASSGGSAKAVYNAIPSKVAMNVPSVGFEATGTQEFGDAVALGGTARTLQSMTVLMSSWACQSGAWQNGDCLTTPGATFSVPLTFTIYDYTGSTQGAVLAQKTQSFDIAYRPSASTVCTDGRWYNKADKTCYNGFPQSVTMSITAAAPLPTQVVWTIAYNTNTAGHSPTGVSGPADSLNVGAYSFTNAPFVGTDLDPTAVVVVNPSGYYTDTDSGPPGHSNWTGLRPLGTITAK